MNCPNCGALIPDGSVFCGACGANLTPQPQQNMQGGYQQQNMQGGFQPQQNMQGGFPPNMPGGPQVTYVVKPKTIRVPKYVKPSICRIVGAVLILVFSFVPVWFGAGYGGGYMGAGFFATGGGVLALWGVLFILAGLALLFLEIDVPSLRNLQSSLNGIPFFRFYIPSFCVLNFILGTFAHSGGTDLGWGWWMILLGILLTFVAPVVDMIKEKNQM